MAKFIYTGKMKEEIETRMIEDPDAAIDFAAEAYQDGKRKGYETGLSKGVAATLLGLLVSDWIIKNPDKIKEAGRNIGSKAKGAINSVTGKIKSHFTKDEDEEA